MFFRSDKRQSDTVRTRCSNANVYVETSLKFFYPDFIKLVNWYKKIQALESFSVRVAHNTDERRGYCYTEKHPPSVTIVYPFSHH